MKRLVTAGFAFALTLTFAGCSSTPTPTASPTPSVSLPAAMTPAEAKAAYKLIAKASCTKAQAEGVVETGNGFTVVMTTKSQNYKDFSAAYLEEPDNYGLLWELDSITSCTDWYTFSMADEAGQEAAIKVTFNPADSTFTTVEDFGDSGIYTYKYTVADGRLATCTNVDNPEKVTSIKYGALDAEGLKILTTAVDRYLAKN